MKSLLLPILSLYVFLGASCWAQTETDTPRRVAILADFSDQSQFALENQVFQALNELNLSGRLEGLADFQALPQIINVGQADGQKLLAAWGLGAADLPVLALTDNATDASAGKLLWHWKVVSVPSAMRALEAQLGIASSPQVTLIRAADYTPRNGPLGAGQTITVTVQGTPGGAATADIGGVQGLALFEQQSGLYRGGYTVSPEDRTNAAVTTHLTVSGQTESRMLGHIVLQGVQAPNLQSVRQAVTGEWLFAGTAPPNSQVTVDFTISQSFIFKFKDSYSFKGAADSQGHFQITANIQEKLSGSEGKFKVTATLGTSRQSSEQKLVFQGRPSGSNPPSSTRPGISPWSLAGNWNVNGQAASIRANGSDSVVIRNERGEETQLWYSSPWRLTNRAPFPFTGELQGDGKLIRWSNGSVWKRSGHGGGGGLRPNSLTGQWYHGSQLTSIRNNGRDSVVIRNEYGQETVLYINGNTIQARGVTSLSGRVSGRTIQWNNGTQWTRNPQGQNNRGITGRWYSGSQATTIRQEGNNVYVIRNERGEETTMRLMGVTTLSSQGGNLTGFLVNGGRVIRWSNGSHWSRKRGG